MNRQEIRDIVKSNDVRIIRLLFTDVIGRLKGLNIAVGQLDQAMDEGVNFDGSSVEGFVRIEESDLLAMPDLSTFKIFPFETGGVRSAMFICDVHYPDGRPLESDPRRILRLAIDKCKEMGFDDFFVGPELEYFYFPSDTQPVPMDSAGYFDILPLDKSVEARKQTLATLNAMGITMEASHHEVAHGQHELDYRYCPALKMADQLLLSKIVVKQVARENGIFASFMPKPIGSINGSGMHVHQSLFRGGQNAFFSEQDPYNLSDTAGSYIAGLLTHAQEITAVTNQWVNSYKRLVPGFEAPVYVSWGRRNRSALVRVPSFRAGKSESCRVEYRAPDPAANPYLAFAVMLAAGLAGVRGKYVLPNPVEKDIYHMSESEKSALHIDSLPGDLYTATRAASRSSLVRETLGEELTNKFLANKFAEWDRYRTQVTDYEVVTYLPAL